ncbi:T9SS type A sorting domain-containing protein [Hymenobacter lapidiphilus]|nr:T9SS type A sorting domain-containing protein [Hymenobacter lapidiphilus]
MNGRFSLRFEPLIPTATGAALNTATIKLYPNPAYQSFVLLLPAVRGAKQVQATLLNILGQVVRRQTASLPAAGARLDFNVRGLPAGVYILQLQAGSELLAQRIVIE